MKTASPLGQGDFRGVWQLQPTTSVLPLCMGDHTTFNGLFRETAAAAHKDDPNDFRIETSFLPHQPTHNNPVPTACSDV